MKRKPTILIVDDEHDFALTLKTALEKEKFDVLITKNRIQAQKTAWTERPEMIVLGTITPRGDAFLLHQWLKETPLFRDTSLIVIDAPPEKYLIQGWTREEGLRNNADDFLRKPVIPAALVIHIQKLLDKTTKRISVLVADDHPVVRDGIRALLELQKDIQVIGEAVDGEDALTKTHELLPDIVLMDIVMPKMNGLEASKRICKECEKVKVLMLTQYDDEENVLASKQAGAAGFIPKRSASSQLLDSIRAVSEGKDYMPPTASRN